MTKCEMCGLEDDDVLVFHHIDGNYKNNNPSNLIVICYNCHIKIHKRNFKKQPIISLKAEIFNDMRLRELIDYNKERDKKVNAYLKHKFFSN